MGEQPEPGSRESLLVRWLCRLVAAAQRSAWRTVALVGIASLGLGLYASTHLRFNVDPNALFSEELRFQRMIVEFQRYFPVLTNSLLVVIDEGTPEATRDAQQRLAAVLSERTDVFSRVFLPGEDPFFERVGLLYGSIEELEEFGDNMALMQPVLGELSVDPSLETLARVVRQALEEIDPSDVDTERWEKVLDHFRSATVTVFDDFPVAVSWESVLLEGSGLDPTAIRVIVLDPILDLDRVLAAHDSIEAVRQTVSRLGLGPETGMRVRITGYPALNHEEMLGLVSDTTLAGGLSFLLVVLVLSRAYRSARMVLAAAITLLAGLVWAAAFAAATVTELNPLSITFGVLVIGLGVDFMIHLGMHFSELARLGSSWEDAMLDATRDCGAALVLCAATTTVGFLAFVPTEYRGVSDLGMAAAGGMLAILLLTFTIFPALVRLLLPAPAFARLVAQPEPRSIVLHVLRHPVPICAVAAALGGIGIFLFPRVDLDTDVIRIRNPDAESVQAFQDLLDDRDVTPWYLDVLAPSLADATRLADRIRELPTVDRVVTLADYIPKDQDEKLEILGDVALFLDLPEMSARETGEVEKQTEALATLRDFLAVDPVSRGATPLAESVRRLRDALDRFLARAETHGDTALPELERILLDPVPAQFERLRANLEVEPVTRDTLPPGLVSRMLAAGGQARIQVYPSENLLDHDAMVRFVESVRSISSEITGLPVNLVESARATWASLRSALVWASLAIAVLLLVLWRRIGDTLIALGPLLLAVLMTQTSTVWLPVPLNFVNIVVLPLLLGIGIDSGVHLVYRSAKMQGNSDELLTTTTARAVLFSAVTTLASFGTLVLSQHRGVSSLGTLLVIGMVWTLAANLLLLPALLSIRQRRRSRAQARS